MKALLRFYANNRRRSWRNGTHDAFVDATFQLETLLSVLIGGTFLIFAAIGKGVLHIASDGKDKIGMFVGLGLVLIVISIIHNKIKVYEFIPGVEKTHTAPRDRLFVYLYNLSGLLYLIFVVVATRLIRGYFAA